MIIDYKMLELYAQIVTHNFQLLNLKIKTVIEKKGLVSGKKIMV